ncbi:hypothetical protein GCM10009425_45140 [Pseudomonas asuensis]|uniref:Uncharacterized protein n=1 Tax=Pseudomonas asuensis TaxID=1825787 RepID=A0ABQ2H3Z2_9PSED|nr:hypothetical protein GCM10009425_45140 [Pseudomonas asuensis]
MTHHVTLRLDLNASDLEALAHLLMKRQAIAEMVAGSDVREEVRIRDVLDLIAEDFASSDAGKGVFSLDSE